MHCISIILPVRDESGHIAEAVTSLLAQEAPDFEIEILAIDGKSTDGTLEILHELAARDSRLRILINERRTTPCAFNIGLQAARGDLVCIMGAHAIYESNYLRVCFRELNDKKVVGCSGRVITQAADRSLQTRLVAWTLAHPFGTSATSSRRQAEGYAETVPYPLFRKQPLLDLGGYDEGLLRNQDNDMNQRLRAAGHKFYLTWGTSAAYFPKRSISELMRFAFRNGYWNAISLRNNPTSMSFRHRLPFLFVLSLFLSVVVGAIAAARGLPARIAFLSLMAIIGAHWLAGIVSAFIVAWEKRSGWAILLPAVFFTFHTAYGLGTAWGLITGADKAYAGTDPGTLKGLAG